MVTVVVQTAVTADTSIIIDTAESNILLNSKNSFNIPKQKKWQLHNIFVQVKGSDTYPDNIEKL